jgi:GTP cyclohydrolase FolE2
MTTETKINNIKINEPYKIITVACDVTTKDDNGVIIKVERLRETFCPTDTITSRLNVLNLSDEDKAVITDATSNWTDEIKTAYTTYMENLV